MSSKKPPAATAADVLNVLSGPHGTTLSPEAKAVLASYFTPGPEPRYDTTQAQAEAEAEAEAGL